MKFFQKKTFGLSLAEILVASGIFVIVTGMSATTGILIYKGKAKVQHTNTLYTESQFIMERLVKEIRENTIDYPEYFSQNIGTGVYGEEAGLSSTEGDYGENPGLYEMFFYYIPNTTEAENDVSNSDFSWKQSDRNTDISIGAFNTGANDDTEDDNPDEYTLQNYQYPASIDNLNTRGLYLLSEDGMTKTLFRYTESENPETGNKRGEIEMAKMELLDNNNSDGQYDTWDYIHDFQSITPPDITVTDFTFFLSPRDDPYQSYEKSDTSDGESVFIQPHVILKITSKLSESKENTIIGENKEFTLQTTATSRIFHAVTFPRL